VRNMQANWKEVLTNQFSAYDGSALSELQSPEQLVSFIETEIIEKLIRDIGTHLPGEYTGYCDTGEDMELACRSECVDMAINRIKAKWLGKESNA
jgi:hypothetical protein